jgi:hypothetical protein
MKNVDANDFVVFNLFEIGNRRYLDNIWLLKYLLNKYKNISMYNIILNEETNAGTCGDVADSLEKFLLRHGVNNMTFCGDKNAIKKHLGLTDSSRVVVTDRRYDVRGIFDNPRDIGLLENSLAQVAENRIFYSRSKLAKKKGKSIGMADEYLVGSLGRIALVKNFNGTATPMLAILDSYSKRVFITKFSGEILYIVESENFCLPSSIKCVDDRLFILDSCSGSVGYLDFEKQKFIVSKNSDHLLGATDFEFRGEDTLVFSRVDGKLINILEGDSLSIPGEIDSTGEVDVIKKFNDSFYYLDRKNKVLHLLKDGVDQVVLDLIRTDGIPLDSEITNFHVSTENDIYLVDTPNQQIFRCYSGQCSKQPLSEDLHYPNDLILYKNLMFISADRHIQLFDIYSGESYKISLYVSENSRHMSDTLNTLDLANIDSVVSPEALDALQFVGLDGARLLNPSFLLFLKDYDDKLFIEKFINYESIIGEENIYSTDNGGSIVYGRLYYDDFGETKIRTLVGRLAGEGEEEPRKGRAKFQKESDSHN